MHAHSHAHSELTHTHAHAHAHHVRGRRYNTLGGYLDPLAVLSRWYYGSGALKRDAAAAALDLVKLQALRKQFEAESKREKVNNAAAAARGPQGAAALPVTWSQLWTCFQRGLAEFFNPNSTVQQGWARVQLVQALCALVQSESLSRHHIASAKHALLYLLCGRLEANTHPAYTRPTHSSVLERPTDRPGIIRTMTLNFSVIQRVLVGGSLKKLPAPADVKAGDFDLVLGEDDSYNKVAKSGEAFVVVPLPQYSAMLVVLVVQELAAASAEGHGGRIWVEGEPLALFQTRGRSGRADKFMGDTQFPSMFVSTDV